MPGFNDNEEIKGILLNHKILPLLHNNERFLLAKTS